MDVVALIVQWAVPAIKSNTGEGDVLRHLLPFSDMIWLIQEDFHKKLSTIIFLTVLSFFRFANPIATMLIFQSYCFMNTALRRAVIFCLYDDELCV